MGQVIFVEQSKCYQKEKTSLFRKQIFIAFQDKYISGGSSSHQRFSQQAAWVRAQRGRHQWPEPPPQLYCAAVVVRCCSVVLVILTYWCSVVPSVLHITLTKAYSNMRYGVWQQLSTICKTSTILYGLLYPPRSQCVTSSTYINIVLLSLYYVWIEVWYNVL